ncbi:restriction endonuclease subunit S [Leptospira selangorensis]|uniref:restriction endonuclease subunit S n=1 Tax=Leptospira selangorensis TaxID=2484982 RepID=UPI00108290FD|nr:restriction endonuclease subunit S [Leptospira selangorensis]TGK06121.1 restriction endonuclease subunit S [Leptospira selangorensis]
MGSEWKEGKLIDLYEISSGLSKSAESFGSGFPFLTFKDVLDNYFVPSRLEKLVESNEEDKTKCSIKRGDVFLTRTSETMNELGMSSVALNDFPNATFNGFTKRLRPKDPNFLIPEYVAYYFRSPLFRSKMYSFSTMSTRASLNNEMIGHLSIVFPSANKQWSIGHILKTLDDKIELNRKMNQTLEAMSQALFQSWFVDFDPVIDNALDSGNPIPEALQARAQARANLGSARKPLPEEIQRLFPNKFVQHKDMGWIPEGWDVNTIGKICEVIDCLHAKKPDRVFEASNKILLQLNNIREDGLIDITDKYLISNSDYSKWISRIELAENDCVITNVGRVGAVAIVPRNLKAALGRNITAIRLQEGNDFPGFLITLLNSKVMKQEISKKTDVGTILNALNVFNIPHLRFIFKKEIALVAEKQLRSFVKNREFLIEQNMTLSSLRDTLLPKLLSGQLQVPDAEKLVAGVL